LAQTSWTRSLIYLTQRESEETWRPFRRGRDLFRRPERRLPARPSAVVRRPTDPLRRVRLLRRPCRGRPKRDPHRQRKEGEQGASPNLRGTGLKNPST